MARTGLRILIVAAWLAPLFAAKTLGQIVERENLVRQKLRLPAKKIPRFNPSALSANELFIRVDNRTMQVAPEDFPLLNRAHSHEVKRISYVTSRCSEEPDHIKGMLDVQRIEALYEADSALFTSIEAPWDELVQATCRYDYEARDWTFGFVIALGKPLNLNGLRLAAAEKNEFSEEDMLQLVRTFNAPGATAPPSEFRSGSAKKFRFSEKYLKKTPYGYAIKLGRGEIPTPTVCDGVLYMSGGLNSSNYFAFHTKDGKIKWAIQLSDTGPTSAACEDGILIFNTYSCTLFAVDAASGAPLWSYFLGDIMVSAPSIAAGRVYTAYPSAAFKAAPSPTHVFAALDLKTGRILWQRWIDAEIIGAPAIAGDQVNFATFSGAVYGFSPAGDIRFAYRARSIAAPQVAGGSFILNQRSDAKGEGAATAFAHFDTAAKQFAARGEKQPAPELDRRQRGDAEGATPIAHLEAAYVQTARKNVHEMLAYQGFRPLLSGKHVVIVSAASISAYDAQTGKKIWSAAPSQGAFSTSPAAAGGYVFVGTNAGQVHQISAEDGKIAQTFKVGGNILFEPVVDSGRVFVSTADGSLHAIDTGNKALTGWNAFGGGPARVKSP